MIKYAVCMATYNGSNFLREQIASIVSQLKTDEILFISDDASTDSTIDIIASFGDKVKLVDSSRAGGVVANFERVLTAAYNAGACNIILSDQDDKWLDGRMSTIRERLSSTDMIMMNGYVTDFDLNQTGLMIFDQVNVKRGLFRNFIKPSYVGCCMAFKRDILGIALPFPRAIPWHDWFISLIGELYFLVELEPNPTIFYRRHSNNYSNTGEKSDNSFFKKIIMRLFMLCAMAIVVSRRWRSNK